MMFKLAMPSATQQSNMRLMNAVANMPGLDRRFPLIARAPEMLVILRATRRAAAKSLDAAEVAVNFTKQSTKRIYGTHQ